MMTNPRPPKSMRPATAKSSVNNRGATLLKSAVAVGAIVATLVGAQTLAQTDQAISAVSTTYTVDNGVLTVTGSQQVATVPNLTVDNATLDQILNSQLAPIPNITMPRVTARSSSSR